MNERCFRIRPSAVIDHLANHQEMAQFRRQFGMLQTRRLRIEPLVHDLIQQPRELLIVVADGGKRWGHG